MALVAALGLALAPAPSLGRAQTSGDGILLQPPLRLDGHVYEVRYAAASTEASAIHVFGTSAAQFAKRKVRYLAVTRDGAPVGEAGELARVFSAYTAAAYQYKWGPVFDLGSVPEGYQDDIRRVVDNPIFLPYRATAALKGRDRQVLETFRSLLTADYLSPESRALVDRARQEAESAGTIVAAVDRAAEALRWSDSRTQRALHTVFADWRTVLVGGQLQFTAFGQRLEIANGLDLVALGVRLATATRLNQDRADWLAAYLALPGNAIGQLDAEQDRVADEAIGAASEPGELERQILREFVRDKRDDLLVHMGEKLLVEHVVKWAAHKYGFSLAVHHVMGSANVIALTYLLGDVAVGAGDLISHMTMAGEADELRLHFAAGRLNLQRLARSGGPPAEFDGDAALRYRAAYMLEALAAAQAHRSYADGSDSVLGVGICGTAGVIRLRLNLCAEKRAASGQLRAIANAEEQLAESLVGHPEYIPAAVLLASGEPPPAPPRSRLPLPRSEEARAAMEALLDALARTAQTAAAALAREMAEASEALRRAVRRGPPPTPAEVAANYLAAVTALDAEAAVMQFRPADRFGMRLVHVPWFAFARALDVQISLEDASYELAGEAGDTATVRMRGTIVLRVPTLGAEAVGSEDLDEQLPMVREGGAWYVRGSDEVNALLRDIEAVLGE